MIIYCRAEKIFILTCGRISLVLFPNALSLLFRMFGFNCFVSRW